MPRDNIKFWTWKTKAKEPTPVDHKLNQQVVVLLLSITDLGGQGTKREVLDNIITRNYLLLDAHDKELTESGQEPIWENELAWKRNKLKELGDIDANVPGTWRITEHGKKTLKEGINSFLINKSFNAYAPRLSENWYKRAKEYLEEM